MYSARDPRSFMGMGRKEEMKTLIKLIVLVSIIVGEVLLLRYLKKRKKKNETEVVSDVDKDSPKSSNY